MVHVRSERFLCNSFKKLHTRVFGSFCLISRQGSNAYLLDLSPNLNVRLVFNVEDLFPFQRSFEPPPLSTSAPASSTTLCYRKWVLPHTPPPVVDQIETVLEDQVVFTSEGATSRYLVQWTDCSITDATWISEDELCHLDAKFLVVPILYLDRVEFFAAEENWWRLPFVTYLRETSISPSLDGWRLYFILTFILS